MSSERVPPSRSAQAKPTWAVVQSALVAAMGGLLFGFDTAVISGATDAIQAEYALDANSLGFTVAIALVGTIFGAFGIGKPADRFGRKAVFYCLAIGYFVSALGCALAPNWHTFLFARFVGGLAIGAASVVAPMYIAEISPSAWRGRLVAINQLNVVMGILLSFVSNYAISAILPPESAWRWMLGIVAVPSLLFLLLLVLIPESPRWLVRAGRLKEAAGVLGKLGEPDVETELHDIQASLPKDSAGHDERLFQARYRWPIFLAWSVAMFNQLAGINALMYYAPKIFSLAGVGRESSLLNSIAIGGTNLVFTMLALLIIDRFGRRVLLLIGSVGTAVCLGITAWQFARPDGASGGVVLAALLGYIAFFAFSQGAVIWVFIAEVFPNSVRAKGQALGCFTHWVMAAVVSWGFPVVAEMSSAAAFAFFATMMVLQFVFAWKVMPETKGGTLEDIERRLGLAPVGANN